MTRRVNVNQHHPLFLAVFRALTPYADDQVTAAKGAEEIISAILSAGMRLSPDRRHPSFKKFRHGHPSQEYQIPLQGDVAFSQGWDVTASPHEAESVAHHRWIADWYKAWADAYEAHIDGAEQAGKEQ